MPLSSSFLNRISTVKFTNSADIDNYFVKTGGEDFISWFNTHIAGKGSWVRPEGNLPITISTDTYTRNRFNQLWSNESIQTIFEAAESSLLQFIALQSIILNETGNLSPGTENIGRPPEYSGIAYAFDEIPGLKRSYNTIYGNKNCLQLFNDENYNRAFDSLALGAQLKNTKDTVWGWQLYPKQIYPTSTHPEITGYILEADFLKFRGRGFIQTTGRTNYVQLINYIMQYTGSNSVVNNIKNQWSTISMDSDVLATISTNNQWDVLFQESDCLIPAKAIAIHNGNSKNRYHPSYLQALTEENEIALQNSLHNMGRSISGSGVYATLFENRVLEVMELL